ncbi:hypothetical protein P2O49_25035, partial [Escherichia coli]
DRNRSHWSTSKTPSYTKSVSWQHHQRLVQKRLASGELVAPFGDMTVKCHQHYYITTLPGRQWPKIEAFIIWLREQVKTTS